MRKFLRKSDIILLVALVAAGILAAAASFGGAAGKRAVVRVDGEIYGSYDLETNQTVIIESGGHKNEFTISGGQVQMTDADCSGRDCVRMGAAGRVNQTIVCLPNRVSITIEGEEEDGDVDIIAG